MVANPSETVELYPQILLILAAQVVVKLAAPCQLLRRGLVAMKIPHQTHANGVAIPT